MAETNRAVDVATPRGAKCRFHATPQIVHGGFAQFTQNLLALQSFSKRGEKRRAMVEGTREEETERRRARVNQSMGLGWSPRGRLIMIMWRCMENLEIHKKRRDQKSWKDCCLTNKFLQPDDLPTAALDQMWSFICCLFLFSFSFFWSSDLIMFL